MKTNVLCLQECQHLTDRSALDVLIAEGTQKKILRFYIVIPMIIPPRWQMQTLEMITIGETFGIKLIF
jgi:hypothetical protein